MPAQLSILLVDQEVRPSEDSCVATVMARDVKRTALLEREAELLAMLQDEKSDANDADWWTVCCV